MSTKTIYTVYKTTNNVNGKIYIGIHKQQITEDLQYYLGSGKLIKQAIEKYGEEKFTKELLHSFDNPEDMYDMEAHLVNQDFIDRRDTYNIKLGGEGGWDHIDTTGIPLTYDVWNKGLITGPNSEETNKKISNTLKKRYENQDGNRKGYAPWNKGRSNPHAKTEQLNDLRFECEYCGKITNKGNYKRWHSNNCKNK